MAISWLQANGIPTKIMEDVLSTFKGHTIYDVYGTNPNFTEAPSSNVQIREPLSISHLIPSFILFGMGLFLSLIAFCAETCQQKIGPLVQERWAHFCDVWHLA